MSDSAETASDVPTVRQLRRDGHGRFAPRLGAPLGNRRTIRHGLSAGALPVGCRYIGRQLSEFRKALETAVAEKGDGSISLVEAALIQTAIRHERHCLLTQRWIQHEAERLSPDQKLAFSRDVGASSDKRDKCLAQLGLDRRDEQQSIATFYARSRIAQQD